MVMLLWLGLWCWLEGTYEPDWRGEETEVYSAEVGVDGFDDHCGVALDADADAYYTEVHDEEGPQAPVEEHAEEVLERPCRAVVHALQVMIVDFSVPAGQRRGAAREPS